MDALKLMSESCLKKDIPVVNVGDTVRVQVRIQEGNRERLQAFEGTVIAKKHGGIAETFTVRRLSHGCGVERVFPIHSPKVASVELVRKGRVRRGKLYYPVSYTHLLNEGSCRKQEPLSALRGIIDRKYGNAENNQDGAGNTV